MKKLLLFVLLLSAFCAKAQPYFPPDGTFFSHKTLARIDIFINKDSLAYIYNPANIWSDHEFQTTFIYHTDSAGVTIADTLQQVGFCLRGNTSRGARKKSFKVSFNTYVHGRKFYGLEKLHLNGDHNDPSIMRTDLYWKTLAGMGVPGSRCNHVNLYLNGKFYGVYVNVENYDENFVQSRFGNNSGNLYKCLYPADLTYLGSKPTSYIVQEDHWLEYALETNTSTNDYSDLANLIYIINKTPDSTFLCQLEKVFNVNSFLKVYAVEIATGNWDNFIYNKNNFYLYHNTETGQFEFIPYDVDNTFGVDFIGGDWGNINIYNWYDNSNQRPLVKRLLAIPAIKNRLSYYINQLQSRLANPANINPYIDSTETLISPSAELDSFRTLDYGYTYNQFVQSFTQALNDGHTNYGLKPFIQTRHDNTASQLQLATVPPLLAGPVVNPTAPYPGDTVWIFTKVETTGTIQSAVINYNLDNGPTNTITLLDDGQHHDGAAGDGKYGGGIPGGALNDSIHYSLIVTDAAHNTSRLPECDYYSIKFTGGPKLYINEWMASNHATIKDEFGEYDDWFEIYNGDANPVSLNGVYATDNFANPLKWALPDITLAPGQFILIWADDQTSQGDHHANFKLSASGEDVGLYSKTGNIVRVIDSVSFGAQTTDISQGCYPDGIRPFVFFSKPTPDSTNVNGVITGSNAFSNATLSVNVYPNPGSDNITVAFTNPLTSTISITLIDMTGREIQVAKPKTYNRGLTTLTFSASQLNLPDGIYSLKVAGVNNGTQQAIESEKRVVIIR